MEKILLGAYLSVLAAFITAVSSIVKLVNEKESKTTDYRQSWTDSVRKSLSQLIASISLQANYIAKREQIKTKLAAHIVPQNPNREKANDAITDFLKDRLQSINDLINENQQTIQQNYALTALHFKPNDEIFIKIENKVDQAEQLLQEMVEITGSDQDGKRNVIKEKILTITNEVSQTSRFILKTEWETVKKGEPAYKTTKNWSLYIGISTFAVLVISGIYILALSQASRNNLSITQSSNDKTPQTQPSTLKESPEINQTVKIYDQRCPQIIISRPSSIQSCKSQAAPDRSETSDK